MKFNIRAFVSCCMGAIMLSAAGCTPPPNHPPVSMAEYEKNAVNTSGYPRQTIVLYNLTRVLSNDRPAAERLASFQLVARLGDDDPAVRKELAGVLSQQDTPRELYQAVLDFLLKKDYPDLAIYVAQMLPNASRQDSVRETILDWLAKHPEPAVLSEIVKLWAAETNPSGPNESRYRQVIERVGGKPWDDCLVDGINTPDFFARGSALEILSRRIPAPQLRQRILRVQARSDAMSALHVFLDRLGYMPANGQEFLSAAYLYAMRRDMVEDVARLASKWRDEYGYQFNIRDFHLLSRLSRDPLRSMARRADLAVELSKSLSARNHVHRKAAGADDNADSYNAQVDNLTMVDVWNLCLVNEMLSRPLVQTKLRAKADRDRGNYFNAWGGLIFFENGQAEAKLYPMEQPEIVRKTYTPSPRCATDGRDSICRFIAHFDKIDNAAMAGPTADEIRDARQGNYYGVILTSLGDSAFCAHYFSPQGVVVSLGVFSLR